MLPKSVRLRLLLGGPALLALGLAAGWLRAVEAPDTSGVKGPAETWKEPTPKQGDPAKSIATLTQRAIWGDAAPESQAEAAKSATPDWRLSGIVSQRGAPVAVILLTEAGKAPPRVEYIKIGDALPDGSHLVDIAKTAITVAGDSGQRQVHLFYPK
jgi:hypothetical protein